MSILPRLPKLSKKIYFIIGAGLLLVCFIILVYLLNFSRPMNWGITYAWYYTEEELGLDPQETYLAILDDLKVDRIRLSAYWNEIEAEKGVYDFSRLDWLMQEAEKRDVKVILAVGRRLPRWPECHDPIWLEGMNLLEIDERLLKFVETSVKRYQNYENIIYIQVENEPFLSTFGICPKPDANLLKTEIKLVKSLTDKPILVTDSGELSTWLPISNSGGEILGTTIYRVVYNPMFGYFRWFTPPSFYWLRAFLIKRISPLERVIVAELQGESWHTGEGLTEMTLEQHNKSLSLKQLKKNIEFTRRAGFDEAYLWGAEWWYFMKTEKEYDGYWEEAKKLWQ
jgi:hypothetical protein